MPNHANPDIPLLDLSYLVSPIHYAEDAETNDNAR